MKIMLLAGLYLFFVRVLWSVYNELRDPRTAVRRQPASASPQTVRAAPSGSGSAPGSAPFAPPAPPAAAVAPSVAFASHAGSAAGGGATMAPPAPMIGQLMVREPAHLAGLTWALGNEITLGRVPTCGIHLDDTYVSSVHARIFAVDGAFMIEDLDSRNGTVLNGASLTATTALRPGDVISVGATAMEFS